MQYNYFLTQKRLESFQISNKLMVFQFKIFLNMCNMGAAITDEIGLDFIKVAKTGRNIGVICKGHFNLSYRWRY